MPSSENGSVGPRVPLGKSPTTWLAPHLSLHGPRARPEPCTEGTGPQSPRKDAPLCEATHGGNREWAVVRAVGGPYQVTPLNDAVSQKTWYQDPLFVKRETTSISLKLLLAIKCSDLRPQKGGKCVWNKIKILSAVGREREHSSWPPHAAPRDFKSQLLRGVVLVSLGSYFMKAPEGTFTTALTAEAATCHHAGFLGPGHRKHWGDS